jgi:hypothetical protein
MGDQPDRKITALARRNHTAIRQPQRAGRMPRRDMPDDPPKARHKRSPAQSCPSWTVVQQAISSADPVRAPDRTPERSVFAKRQCLARAVHQKDVAHYTPPAELSQRIYAAAVETGSDTTFFAAAGRFGLGSVFKIRIALTEGATNAGILAAPGRFGAQCVGMGRRLGRQHALSRRSAGWRADPAPRCRCKPRGCAGGPYRHRQPGPGAAGKIPDPLGAQRYLGFAAQLALALATPIFTIDRTTWITGTPVTNARIFLR